MLKVSETVLVWIFLVVEPRPRVNKFSYFHKFIFFVINKIIHDINPHTLTITRKLAKKNIIKWTLCWKISSIERKDCYYLNVVGIPFLTVFRQKLIYPQTKVLNIIQHHFFMKIHKYTLFATVIDECPKYLTFHFYKIISQLIGLP